MSTEMSRAMSGGGRGYSGFEGPSCLLEILNIYLRNPSAGELRKKNQGSADWQAT